MELSGRVAAVTGGSRGLGLLLAGELGRQGCQVAICARNGEELERARLALGHDGADVLTVPCDVADRGQAEDFIAQTVRHFGSLDVLVNNAGLIQVGPVHTMQVEDFEAALGVMFWGLLYPTLAALPHLRQRGGRLVNITSIGGKISAPHLLPYNCAKFAAVGFSEGLTAELAGQGIQVTTVVPGLMRTGSPLNAFFKGRPEREFAWFTVADSIPGLSINAERAARQIVAAAKRGRAEIVLTVPAKLAVRAHGLLPATTTRVLQTVNRMLPGADLAQQAAVRGMEAHHRLHSRSFNRLAGRTLAAARRLHQLPEHPAAPTGPSTPPPSR